MTNKNDEFCSLILKGLHCAACVNWVETYLNKIDGVTSANVNLATQKALVQFDGSTVNIDDLKNAVKDAGYDVIKAVDKKKI